MYRNLETPLLEYSNLYHWKSHLSFVWDVDFPAHLSQLEVYDPAISQQAKCKFQADSKSLHLFMGNRK